MIKLIKFIFILLFFQCTEVQTKHQSNNQKINEDEQYSVPAIYQKEPLAQDKFVAEPEIGGKNRIKSLSGIQNRRVTLQDFELSGNVKQIGEGLYDYKIDENRIGVGERGDSLSYIFNKYGKIVKSNVFDSNDVLKWYTTFNYDLNQNLIRSETVHENGGVELEANFIYNDNNELIKKFGDSSISNITIFEYNNHSLLVQKRYFTSSRELISNSEYTYDQKGNIETVIVTNKKDEFLSRQIYKYNEYYQVIERMHEGEPNGAGRESWKYEYNLIGHRKKATRRNLIVNYVYEYDKLFNWTKETKYFGDEPNFIIVRNIRYFVN